MSTNKRAAHVTARNLHSGANARVALFRLFLPLVVCAALIAAPASALIDYTREQSATAKELIEQLEQRHYAKLKYDEELASEHFDNYIKRLDSGRMFFSREDLRALEPLRADMVGELRRGKLDVGFAIFNREWEHAFPSNAVEPSRPAGACRTDL